MPLNLVQAIMVFYLFICQINCLCNRFASLDIYKSTNAKVVAKWVNHENAVDGASTEGLFTSEHPYIFDFRLMVLIPFVIFFILLDLLMNSIVFMQSIKKWKKKSGETLLGPTLTGTITLDPTLEGFNLLKPVSHSVNRFLWWKCLDCLDWNRLFCCSECGHSR
jgi:hypothetical protein